MTGQHSRTRETAASAAQYVLLGGFASRGRDLRAGPDRVRPLQHGPARAVAVPAVPRAGRRGRSLRGAAGPPRRAGRVRAWRPAWPCGAWSPPQQPSTGRTPRTARPRPEAFGLMPVVAALLFEFCLRELRLRTADRADRSSARCGWLHPAERFRVQLCLAADEQHLGGGSHPPGPDRRRRQAAVPASARCSAPAGSQPGPGMLAARRIRRAERRAHGALTRAGFAEPADRRRGAPPGPGADPDRRRSPGSTTAPPTPRSAAIASLISAAPAAAPAPDPGASGRIRTRRHEIAVDDRAPSASRSGPGPDAGAAARTATAAGAAAGSEPAARTTRTR